ncbi:MAG TPA: hypothetical protein VHY22_04830 [Chthoniobacteraceae bacterium]|nr:hypothetical protein [Chthoniobacteraceae bacterium]
MERDTIPDEPLTGDAMEDRPHIPWDDDEHRVMTCHTCKLPRVFNRRKTRHSLHFLLSIGTIGLWLPFWGLLIIHQALKPWTCSVCRRRQRNG